MKRKKHFKKYDKWETVLIFQMTEKKACLYIAYISGPFEEEMFLQMNFGSLRNWHRVGLRVKFYFTRISI